MSRGLEHVIREGAAAILSDERHWTCGAWARNSAGDRCDPLAPEAVRWCAVGALEVAAFRLIGDHSRSRAMARAIGQQLAPGPGGLVYINESGTHHSVKTLLIKGAPSHDAPTLAVFDRHGFAAFARRHRT